APDPGHGFYAYQVTTKLTLSVLAFTTSPKPAKSGRSFIAGMAVNEGDTNGPVKSGTVGCTASIGSKHVFAAGHAVTNGIAASGSPATPAVISQTTSASRTGFTASLNVCAGPAACFERAGPGAGSAGTGETSAFGRAHCCGTVPRLRQSWTARAAQPEGSAS